MPKALDSVTSAPWFIIIALLLFFGVIVLVVILVKRHSKAFKSEEKPKSEKEISDEEVNRMLEDVDDPNAQKAMEEYAASEKSADSAEEEEQLGEDKPIVGKGDSADSDAKK